LWLMLLLLFCSFGKKRLSSPRQIKEAPSTPPRTLKCIQIR
jgi:hypothetical protein